MDDARPDETPPESIEDIAGFDEWAAEIVRQLEARREAGPSSSEDTRRSAPARPSPDRPRPSQA
jgi:hypothetical protein